MHFLSVIILIIIAAYVAMLLRFSIGWKSLSSIDNEAKPVSVAVIVPARNEEANIRTCLTDLLRQDYPVEFVQIIIVDDGSDDATATIADELAHSCQQLKVLRAEGPGGKKQALQQGIDASHSQLIATVDADCRIAPTWLSTMVATQQQNGAKMVLGPVVLTPASTLFQRIQRLEFLAIMGITGGSAAIGHPVMANGANLLFDRNAFIEAGGYSGSENPSGDDVFLMLKMTGSGTGDEGRGVVFAKDVSALVSTAPMPSFGAFWQQRKRWLSKKGGYADSHVKVTALLTFLANLGGLAALVISFFLFPSPSADLLMAALFLKSAADLLFIRMVARNLMPTCGLWDILPAQLFILIYVSSIGLFGNVRTYRWKGRNIRVKD